MSAALTVPVAAALVSFKEIAKALGRDESTVVRRAGKDLWPFTEATVQGGRMKLFDPRKLPKDVQDALMTASVQAPRPAALAHPAAEPLPLPSALAGWQRRTMEARAALLLEIDRLAAFSSWRKAAALVVEQAQDATLAHDLLRLVPIANAKSGKAGARTLSLRTLYRWLDARAHAEQAGTMAALAPKEPARPIQVPQWAAALLTLYRQPQKPSLAWCLEQMPKRFPGVPVPSYDQAKRFVKALGPVERNRGRMGPIALKALQAYVARDTSKLWATAVYTADGHTFDAEVQHPLHSRPFRPELTAILDVKTRKAVGWSAALSENTWGTVDALRHAVTTHGVPCIWYVDLGGGFNNQVLDGGADDSDCNEMVGMRGRLGITRSNSIAQNSQARGVMERFQGSVWVRASKALPTFMGADMDRQARHKVFLATRKAVKAGTKSRLLMPWSDFLVWAQAAIDAYNDRPHRSLPWIRDPETGVRRKMTPNEAWAQQVAEGVAIDIPAVMEAEDLFRPYIRRTPRRGLIELMGNRYFAQELVDHEGELLVGYDIRDANFVWVRSLDGRLICKAQWDAHKRDYFPVPVLEQAAAKRADARRKRLEAHLEEVEAERAPRLIEHAPAAPITIEQQTAADAIIAKLEASKPEAAPIRLDGERPSFRDDVSWARWLSENPGRVTADDKELLRGLLQRKDFRMLMDLEGVDHTALQALLKTTQSAEGQYSCVTAS